MKYPTVTSTRLSNELKTVAEELEMSDQPYIVTTYGSPKMVIFNTSVIDDDMYGYKRKKRRKKANPSPKELQERFVTKGGDKTNLVDVIRRMRDEE